MDWWSDDCTGGLTHGAGRRDKPSAGSWLAMLEGGRLVRLISITILLKSFTEKHLLFAYKSFCLKLLVNLNAELSKPLIIMIFGRRFYVDVIGL